MVKLDSDFIIGTTRFNEITAKENRVWREKYKWIGCMYGVPKRICETIPEHQQMVIIEMLNKSPGGEILGFGLIKNYTRTDKHTKIYNDNRFNKYLYNSSHRIECGVVKAYWVHKTSSYRLNKECLDILKKKLFYGYGHMKRGQGITEFRWKRFDNDEQREKIKKFFRELFTSNF